MDQLDEQKNNIYNCISGLERIYPINRTDSFGVNNDNCPLKKSNKLFDQMIKENKDQFNVEQTNVLDHINEINQEIVLVSRNIQGFKSQYQHNYKVWKSTSQDIIQTHRSENTNNEHKILQDEEDKSSAKQIQQSSQSYSSQ